MALFSEPTPYRAPKELDTADIVRDGDFVYNYVKARCSPVVLGRPLSFAWIRGRRRIIATPNLAGSR